MMPVLRSCRSLLGLTHSIFVASALGFAILGVGASGAAAQNAAISQSDATDAFPAAQGRVILHISGEIARGNQRQGHQPIAEFDLDMLRHFPTKVISTGTIWSAGKIDFRGVPLASVLQAVGAKGRILRLTALNDYTIDMPISMVQTGAPILAYEMDGVLLSPRDKGPLWVIYPFDISPEYQNEEIYSRAVWQLVRIEVLP